MAEQKQGDQLEPTCSTSVRIRDVALRTNQKWWTIGRSDDSGSRISVMVARQDDEMMEIGWNTQKSLGDLRRLAVTLTLVKENQLMLAWKIIIIIIINNNDNNNNKYYTSYYIPISCLRILWKIHHQRFRRRWPIVHYSARLQESKERHKNVSMSWIDYIQATEAMKNWKWNWQQGVKFGPRWKSWEACSREMHFHC